MNSAIVNTTQKRFEYEVLKNPLPVLVDFWASWCGPCRVQSPVLDEVAAEYRDRVSVVKVNVDEEPGLAAGFGITSIPTLMIFNKGKPVWRAAGARWKEDLVETFQQLSIV